MSEQFRVLCGGVRTRQLAKLITDRIEGGPEVQKRAEKILEICGLKPKKSKKEESEQSGSERSKMLVYTSRDAIEEMARLLQASTGKSDDKLAEEFGKLIATRTAVPDMALSGRMLETGVLKDTTVEAALQVAHAISTHEARPEVDYYVAADDIPGDDAGAGYVDEAMFASACFYKYFSIHWEMLVENLQGYLELAAHTVGAFIRGAALTNPTGKQNSFAAHNPPDGMLIEFKDTPISYANAFAKPVSLDGGRDMISQSIAQLSQYAYDLEAGYGPPRERFWFSPNERYSLNVEKDTERSLTPNSYKSLDALIEAVIKGIDPKLDWQQVQQAVVCSEVAP